MTAERLLLGPGPSPVSARVMRALSVPVLSHLDPDLIPVLDDVRRRLGWLFGAADDAFSFAVSGTGTSGMETAVANVTAPGTRVLVVVTGYFGERLVDLFTRYGARVARVDGEWGRAIDPDAVRRALAAAPAEVVAMVHAETSTGVVNPLEAVMAIASEHGALTVVDAVTSLGAMPIRTEAWGIDVCYSCTQKGLGAPSGMAPISFSPRARASAVACRSFYLDRALLESYWIGRKYHHTLSSPLLMALREALTIVEEEGLDARYARHERHHRALVAGLGVLGLSVLPPEGERLWTLNTVRVPDGVDEAAVRRELLQAYGIEIGAGLGPLAGNVWRVGLMGAGSTMTNVLLFLATFERALRTAGYRGGAGADAVTAAAAAAAAGSAR